LQGLQSFNDFVSLAITVNYQVAIVLTGSLKENQKLKEKYPGKAIYQNFKSAQNECLNLI
jgi:hypothetical protein